MPSRVLARLAAPASWQLSRSALLSLPVVFCWRLAGIQVRLTGEHPTPRVGQPRNAQESVEFVVNGKVVARDVAEILYDDDLPSIGASSQRAKTGTRVELLKGGEFLRISVQRERERYLIHLPLQK